MNAAWQTRLAALGATLSEFSVRFADDERADIAAVAAGTVAVPLVHLAVIRATGDEAGGFLHNLFSNDVKKLGPNDAQQNSFNTAKGRMLASFTMWREGADYLLATSADIQPAILKKLSMYVMRAKVKLLDGKGDTALIGLAGPRAGEVLTAIGLPVPAALNTTANAAGYTVVRLDAERFIVAVPAGAAAEVWDGIVQGGATPAGTSAWTWLDVQAGVPLITAPMQEEFVPQWVNFELI
ncbi:MAG: folate-binding protein, partial [Zoogloea sp.]|nr:folate-binding protein [Zoogloea sp.]